MIFFFLWLEVGEARKTLESFKSENNFPLRPDMKKKNQNPKSPKIWT